MLVGLAVDVRGVSHGYLRIRNAMENVCGTATIVSDDRGECVQRVAFGASDMSQQGGRRIKPTISRTPTSLKAKEHKSRENIF